VPPVLSAPTPTVPAVPDTPDRVPHPRDALFRRVFGKPANAASELRSVLPPELAERLDMDGLTAVNGSFVDANLRWRHSDVLLATSLEGRDALVYVLVEHQSKTDPLMPWRMLRYMVRIWDRHLAEQPDATRLPLIIPVVVHEGRRPWRASAELSDVIDVDRATAAAEFVPRFRFLLDDLARIDPGELHAVLLRGRPLTPMAAAALFFLQGQRLGFDVADLLEQALDTLREVLAGADGRDDLETILTYSYRVGDETSADRLRQVVTWLGPEAERAYMTIADMIEDRGRTKGLAEALVRLLTLRFGPLPDSVRARLDAAAVEQLSAWFERAVDAPSLDEVFG
jgi:predicted transposase YdaD